MKESKLPVYGGFEKWTQARYEWSLADAWRLGSALMGLDLYLLAGYVEYLLSGAKYLRGTPIPLTASNTELSFRPPGPSDFPKTPEQWVAQLTEFDQYNISLALVNRRPFDVEEFPFAGFYHRGDDILHLSYFSYHFGVDAEEMREPVIGFYSNSGNFGHAVVVPKGNELLIMDPRIYSLDPKTFSEVKEEARRRCGWDVLKTTDEIASQVIPDAIERLRVENDWQQIRSQSIKRLTSKYPDVALFLTRTEHEVVIEGIRECILRARKEQISGNYRDAITQAGFACERLVRLLYPKYGCDQGVGPILFEQEDDLRKKFGGLLYVKDLKRVWNLRGSGVHPPTGVSKDKAVEAVQCITIVFDRFISRTGGALLPPHEKQD